MEQDGYEKRGRFGGGWIEIEMMLSLPVSDMASYGEKRVDLRKSREMSSTGLETWLEGEV